MWATAAIRCFAAGAKERQTSDSGRSGIDSQQPTLPGILVQRPPQSARTRCQPRHLLAPSNGLWFDLAGDAAARRELFQLVAGRLALAAAHSAGRSCRGGAAAICFGPRMWLPGRTLTIYGRTTDAGAGAAFADVGSRGAEAVTHKWTLIARATIRTTCSSAGCGRSGDWINCGALARTMNRNVRAIVSLSQEWSLLSPYTAFLVLESETDYKRWQIDRQVRRRYWKPSEARGDEPLPAQWLAEVTPPTAPSPSVTSSPPARVPLPEASAPRAGELPFDPLSADRWKLRPSFDALVGSAFRGSADFLRRHPHADDASCSPQICGNWATREPWNSSPSG
jgi:hypothetical protein